MKTPQMYNFCGVFYTPLYSKTHEIFGAFWNRGEYISPGSVNTL